MNICKPNDLLQKLRSVSKLTNVTKENLMPSLQLLDYGNIRVNEENEYSVFDIIEVIGGRKDPHSAWKRMCSQYSEVPLKCRNFQFNGRGQKLTPVAKVEISFYIIGLLPGTCGEMYRLAAAEEMCRKLNVKYEDVLGNVTSQNLTTYAKSVDVEVVEEELDQEDIQLQVLETASKIAAAIVGNQKANKQRFNDLENAVRQTAFDSKAEVLNELREVGHTLSEDSKTQTEELKNLLQSGIDDINNKLEAKKNRVHPKRERTITLHIPTDKAYEEILALVEASGMTRTGFCCEVLLTALGITL